VPMGHNLCVCVCGEAMVVVWWQWTPSVACG
jgi:hypothetical protein